MLERQNVSINFAQGVDTKTDEKLVVEGKLTILENGIFTEGRKIKKRSGYRRLSKRTSDGRTIQPDQQGCHVYNEELLLFSGTELLTYSPQSEQWIPKGNAYSVNIDQKTIVRSAASQLQPDMAINQNIALMAWKVSIDGVRFSVKDMISDAFVITDQVAEATAINPKCLACGDFLFLFYTVNNDIRMRRVDVKSPESYSSEVTVATDCSSVGNFYDVVSDGVKMILAYGNANPAIIVKYITQEMTIGAPLDGLSAPVTLTASPSNAITINNNTRDQTLWITYPTATGVKYHILFPSFEIKTNGTLDATATNVVRITGEFSNSNNLCVFYEIPGVPIQNTFIKRANYSTTGVVTAPFVLKRSVGLLSKAVSVFGTVYVGAAYDSPVQATNFVLSQNSSVVAKLSAGAAGGIPTTFSLPKINLVGGFAYFAEMVKTRFISEDKTQYSATGIIQRVIEYGAVQNFYGRKLGDCLHLSGGYLSFYDGQSVVEQGFHLFPEQVSVVDSGAGLLSAGAYLWYAVYAWYDNTGRLHRSAPSVASSLVLPNNKQVTLTIPTLRITQKTAPRSEVFIEIYRTIANGLIAYKLTSQNTPIYNNTTIDSITYVDNAADAAILSNELLYTTGGIVDNISAPSCKVVETFKNRILIAGLEDPLELWFSKPVQVGYGVAFNDNFRVKFNPLGGRISAIKAMDDKVLVFKENLIYVLSGDGPNDAGLNNTFSIPELVTSDVGCPYPNSLVLTPDGIMFKSNKGIYLVSRQLQVSYIGADVEKYNSQIITSADLLQDRNQVRFLYRDGNAILYDYYFRQWSVFTNHQGMDADLWQGNYTYLRLDGSIFVSDESYFLDDNQGYRLKLATAWLKFAGIQGFQRIKRLSVLGNYESAHQLKMSLAYDYETAWTNQVIFNASEIVDTSIYGDDAIYGESTPYGGIDSGVYQFRVHLPRQKCESLRVLFEDITSVSSGESYSLSDLSLEVGVKRGLNKLSITKTVG